ncbi:PLP-dependent aminotransferase family protein [Pseudoruegeria sp. SHC-113]|uniref:MocR-like pyridoxine biosynthesis transcription factor PdxR n=1 Tax=Pseudoruegeria sp. SHC-113 TaxID=2855439 RepID=UPI0021BB64C5|nr:PLP-dependent aminotransferase family protein [Pseudoruegeria sp. SHC-113]MCT8161804.1 PLP-dependent aminotransferase family protein [Pseudoruegeria sp. SHC-113]
MEGTLQQQIQQMVAQGILSGRFQPGEKMPSSRKLAQQLGVSRITVTLAYTELMADDYLTSRGRSGYFVSDNAPTTPQFEPPRQAPARAVDWTRALGQRFAGAPSLRRPENWRQFRFPFIYGQTDPTLFDHQNWRLCAVKALGQRDFEALTADYYERDDPQLIEFIARHTLPRRGIVARPEEILVTMGAQNALWLAAQVLLNQRRTVAMENPCYPGLRNALAQTRCITHPVDIDADGLPPEALPDELDVVFTTPSHHCPTAVTMPLERRQRLIDMASERDFMIVEDDYEFEMSFLKAPSPALKSMDRDGRVIYVGSFSKSLFPGLRLGYLVGAEPFIREARALRAAILRHPPGHIQRTAAYFLSLGHYDSLIRRMGRAYHERRTVMEEAIHAHGLRIAGANAFGGSSFWMEAPEGVDTGVLAQELRAESVLIEPGSSMFLQENPPTRFYRLGYSSIAASRIPEGIARIAAAIDRATG